MPQLAPAPAQVVGTHTPHTLAVPPPPQVAGDAHEPQSRVPPHPSLIAPQLAPVEARFLGVQPSRARQMPRPKVAAHR